MRRRMTKGRRRRKSLRRSLRQKNKFETHVC
jgi:hypothetical protein